MSNSLLTDILNLFREQGQEDKRKMRRPGIEPGSTAWKATMLTFTPPTLHIDILHMID